MKTYNAYIIPALLLSVVLYTFYRNDEVLLNVIWEAIGWKSRPAQALSVRSTIPLPDWMVYNLPEALWIFCWTLYGKQLQIRLASRNVSLSLVPLFIIVAFEILQYLGITKGTFDVLDMLIPFIFWGIAMLIITPATHRFTVFTWPRPAYRFFFLWLIVLLAHNTG